MIFWRWYFDFVRLSCRTLPNCRIQSISQPNNRLDYQGTLLLTWINLIMDKQSRNQESVGWNYLSILKIHRLHHWSLGMDKRFHLAHYNRCNHLSMLGLKFNHVSKRGQWGTNWPNHPWWGITWTAIKSRFHFRMSQFSNWVAETVLRNRVSG